MFSYDIPALDDRDWGGGYLHTGQPNELWSYGEDNYRIMKKYYDIRIAMHDYIKSLYDEASTNGSPLIRAMFYEFPDDEKCWELQDQYMFGPKYLCAPIFKLDQFEREVYLPAGSWKLTSSRRRRPNSSTDMRRNTPDSSRSTCISTVRT